MIIARKIVLVSMVCRCHVYNFLQISMFCFHLGGELFYWRYKGTAKTIKTKVVCGAEEASKIFREFHDSPMGAHTGQTRTRESISKRFYWPGMSVDITKWVSLQYVQTISTVPTKWRHSLLMLWYFGMCVIYHRKLDGKLGVIFVQD